MVLIESMSQNMVISQRTVKIVKYGEVVTSNNKMFVMTTAVQ